MVLSWVLPGARLYPSTKLCLSQATPVTYARRQTLAKAIADMSAEAVSPEQIKRISGYLNNWDSIGFEDRRLVVDGLISQIKATSENVQIEWKI